MTFNQFPFLLPRLNVLNNHAEPFPVVVVTSRIGGCSVPPYATNNLALHVEDDPQKVMANRQRLLQYLPGCSAIQWLTQTHGREVLAIENNKTVMPAPEADGVWIRGLGLAGGILTADCLPVVFWHAPSKQIALAHAGWRGLLSGVLQNVIAAFDCQPQALRAWLGPSIPMQAFEVGPEVRIAFMTMAKSSNMMNYFLPSDRPGHYYVDLKSLAKSVLSEAGVMQVSQGCLPMLSNGRYCHSLFSYRRDRVTGRMATVAYWPSLRLN